MNCAYITVLTNRDYLLGVKVLKKSMDITGCGANGSPFFVLVPNNINEDVLKELYLSDIQYLMVDGFSDDIIQRDNKVSYWKETLFKLKVFDLIQFDKIVFLDSDMIVFNNIDHLFSLSHMSCVAAGQELHPDWIRLNSGLMVIEPNHEEYTQLECLIEPVYIERTKAGLGVGDQDVINAYYEELWKKSENLHISSKYNTMLGYAGYLKTNGEIKSTSDIYIYHFTGKQKPWRTSLAEETAIKLKILKRSKSALDFDALKRYKEILKQVI